MLFIDSSKLRVIIALIMKFSPRKICIENNDFLQGLKNIYKPPKDINYIGQLPDKQPAIAVVGTRKPTNYGREVANKIVSVLAKNRVVIVSGLAIGIDSVAHKSALDVGGTTVAVLGNGLHKIYPATNKHLADKIIDNSGAILSEYEYGVEPRPYHFLQRNRIVSGLCDGVIVIEAAEKSGTLNTAAHALEQGKEVFAIPGNITSKMSAGCNKLLKQGATSVTSAEDILEYLYPNLKETNKQLQLDYATNPAEKQILELLKAGSKSNDELIKSSSLTTTDILIALTNLEINGAIRSVGPNIWSVN